MFKGNLTPRSNSTVNALRFSGGFGQPDGFASVLTVKVNQAGDACFTLVYRNEASSSPESLWSVMLTNEQRKELGKMLLSYEPTLFEDAKAEGV